MKKSSALFIALSCSAIVLALMIKGTAGILFGISAVFFAITAAIIIFSNRKDE